MVVCGGFGFFPVVCGGLRWFAVICGCLSFSHTAPQHNLSRPQCVPRHGDQWQCRGSSVALAVTD